ncbi:unnamed protein product [Vitrella brassicaformis CCMP3155]|uniref:Glutathione peroxidase n=2 Tax=Vitrella brassicaformis TaxID=1169539 RepID=A0A0G4ESK9_VITBC|nr:unnamed protein product [Vitrella brassicaformis CCMP3155]|mmetsp:Transcript_2956/g.6712  ORF Transcript_2956/g.6712 Transcript_2956/m.6712 type:complete len:215 (+) Transcript_2956:52-696(+)|eukprot:CEM00671.1 unnamed protein product [Vitrella brassicaformis CCMP3155]
MMKRRRAAHPRVLVSIVCVLLVLPRLTLSNTPPPKGDVGEECKWDRRHKLGHYMFFDIDGEHIHEFHEFKGHPVLCVIVATRDPHAKEQYEALNDLHDQYHSRGLRIFAFPTNQIDKSEPKEGLEILQDIKDALGVEPRFTMLKRHLVMGRDQHLVFKWLTDNCGKHDIQDNFEKFLIDKKGRPFKRYTHRTDPLAIQHDIEHLLWEGGEHDEL